MPAHVSVVPAQRRARIPGGPTPGGHAPQLRARKLPTPGGSAPQPSARKLYFRVVFCNGLTEAQRAAELAVARGADPDPAEVDLLRRAGLLVKSGHRTALADPILEAGREAEEHDGDNEIEILRDPVAWEPSYQISVPRLAREGTTWALRASMGPFAPGS